MSTSSTQTYKNKETLKQAGWEIKLLYDGECPLCVREVNFLQKRDGGRGWVYAITKLPILGAIANFIYGIWADWRLKLTGRPNLETVMQERQERLGCDDEGRCRVDW